MLCEVVKHSLDTDDRALHSKVYGDSWKSPEDGKQIAPAHWFLGCSAHLSNV